MPIQDLDNLSNADPVVITGDDKVTGAIVDSFRSFKVAEWTRLVGGNTVGNTINARIWTTTLNGSGTAVSGSGLFTLSTGTTADSSAVLQSINVAQFNSGAINAYIAGIRLGDTGVTNNERRWGAWNATDGIYFKISGTTFSVCRLQNGVETAISSESFNGKQPVINTNFHVYEIYYSAGTALFYQDKVLLHTLTTTTTALANTVHFPLRAENKNINGGTTNTSLFIRGQSINRFGRPVGRPRPFFTNTEGTTTLKTESGTVHFLLVNRVGGIGTFGVTLYDNTAGSGTIITQVTTRVDSGPIMIPLNVDFNVGLTIVNSNTNLEVTVIWE
jgi:hypothetical protein